MKVKELIEQLKKLDPELEVVKQKDDEGNGFHLLHTVDTDAYYETSNKSYYLEIYYKEDVKDMIEDYDNTIDDFTQVCVLV